MTRKRGAPIRKTVSLDPFVESMIRRHEAEMLRIGWRNANFSLSLNILILQVFFDHAVEGEPIHKETIEQVIQWLRGDLKLGEKELQKWNRLVEKGGCEQEADPNT